MKIKTVKELIEKIDDDVKEDIDFEDYLFSKYPDLFETDEEGKLLPQSQRCWNSCPKGWEKIVDNLCAAMVSYSKGYRFVKTTNKFVLFKWWIGCKIKNRLGKIAKMLDPLDYGARGFLTQKEVETQKAKHPNKVKWQKRIYSWRRKFNVDEAYVKEYNTCPKIVQIKQKISLCCYVDNATPEVYGMIYLAEKIASVTCEETGQKGSLCFRGGWYRTLCEEKRTSLGYRLLEKKTE